VVPPCRFYRVWRSGWRDLNRYHENALVLLPKAPSLATMPIRNDLLLQQLKRHFGELSAVPPDLLPLLEMVDAAYADLGTAHRPASDRDAGNAPATIPAAASDQTSDDTAWDRFSLVFDAVHDGLIVRGHDGRLLACNPSAMRILGASRDEIVAQKVFGHTWQFVDEDGGPVPAGEIPAAVALRTGKAVHDVILGLLRPGSSTIWVSVTAIPIADIEPGKMGVVLSLCDVTAAKQAETARRETEAKFAGIVESSLDAIIAIDEQQRIVLFNPAAERIFQCSRSAALGQSLDRFIPARFRTGHADHVREYTNSGKTARAMGQGLRLTGLRADGTEFALEASISRFTVGGRSILATTLRDNSERIRVETALRESEEKFKALFDHSPVVMTLRSVPDGRILEVNDAAAAALGATREQIIGTTWADLDIWVHPQDRVRYLQMLYETGQADDFETELRRKNGEVLCVLLSAKLIEAGGQRFSLGLMRDITERKRAEGQLRASEQRFRSLVENAPICIHEIDHEGRFLSMNPAGLAMLGLQEEREILGAPFQHAVSDQDQRQVALKFERALQGETAEFEFEARNRHRLESAFIPIRDTSGAVQRVMGLTQDVTERKRAEWALRDSELRFRRLFERNVSGVYQTSLDGRILDCNQAFASMLGYDSPQELMQLPAAALYPAVLDRSAFVSALLDSKRLVNVEFTGVRKDGSHFVGLESVELVEDDAGGEPFLLGTVIDISQRKRAELELTRMMTHDAVTGLKRYVVMRREIDGLLGSAASRSGLALLYVDLDRFRSVNESMGYEVGDFALKVCAERLQTCVPGIDRISRLGGDEFLVVLTDIDSLVDPLEIADQIRAAIEVPIAVWTYRLHLTCSIGISRFPEHGSTATALLHAADAAMTRAKSQGRNSIAEFSLAQAAALNDRLALGGRLRDAISAGEMVLHYQPLVRASTGQVMGVEALVRWASPELGLLPPARFIQVAEELGLIIELGHWVLEEACRQIQRWVALGHVDFYVSVNVSAHQINRPDFAGEVRGILNRAGVPARMLELELTESAIMDSVERMVATMHALKAIGVTLALDDFGTGFSSLNHLKRLPLHKLKIDQSFVHELTRDPHDAAITRAIIAMAHQLQLTVTAEGVETEAQLGYLRRNHCDDLQGMLLSPPLPADAVDAVFRSRYIMREVFEATRPVRGLLLLDDEENVLHALVRLLRRDGYRIYTATTAAQALDILGRHDIQVIVSDERMPEVRGTVFLSQVKEMYPETIRIVLSGYTDLASITDAVNRGAIYKFLTKPWNDEDLREQISAAFRAHSERAGQPH
jgi:diguanylate cyclase (GGDEF)-like protein/PAS domain S-box-containing protein